jgi:RNA polymerase sigma-70 factor (ECF subfamily)
MLHLPRGDGPTRGTDAANALLTEAVTRAQKGDEEAFRHIYRSIQPNLLNYLRALVGEADAEDVASETWTRIAQDLRTFRGDADGLRGWTATIAHHRAVDHLRRRRPATPVALDELPHRPADNDTAWDAVENITTAQALALIAELPPEQARAILLRVVVGLDGPATGRLLGKNPGAVRTAVHRGLRRLAARLPGHGVGPSPSQETREAS